MLIEIPDDLLAAVEWEPHLEQGTMTNPMFNLLDHIQEQHEHILDARNRGSDNSVVVTISDPTTGEILESEMIVDDYAAICAVLPRRSYADLPDSGHARSHDQGAQGMRRAESLERAQDRRERVLAWLEKHDPNRVGFTAFTIRARLAYLFENDRQCHHTLEQLAAEGKVRRVEPRRWTVAE